MSSKWNSNCQCSLRQNQRETAKKRFHLLNDNKLLQLHQPSAKKLKTESSNKIKKYNKRRNQCYSIISEVGLNFWYFINSIFKRSFLFKIFNIHIIYISFPIIIFHIIWQYLNYNTKQCKLRSAIYSYWDIIVEYCVLSQAQNNQ